MGEKSGWLTSYGHLIALFLSSLLLLFGLFHFRSLDDNRTVSWADVFTVADPAAVVAFLLIGIFIAFGLSRLSPEGRRPAFLLFCVSFGVAAVFRGVPEINVDASRYFSQAKHFGLYGAGFFIREWGRSIPVWTDLPAVPFLYGIIFSAFGESRLAIQICNALLFSFSVVLTFLIGKKLWDADTGFNAGVLLLGIPFLYSQVPLMLVDIPAMFLLLLALFTFLIAVEKGRALRLLLSAAAIMLAFYAKYSMWVMLSVIVVFAVVYRSSLPEVNTSVYLGRTLSIFLAALLLIGAVFLYKAEVFSEQISLLLSYQRPGLRRWGESLFSTFFFQIHPLITLAAVFSAFVAWRKRDVRYLGILWLVILVVVFRVRRIRYIMMVFPMLTLMASYALQEIRRKEVIRCISLSVAACSLAVGVSAYLPFLRQNSAVNLIHAGRYLDSQGIANADVFTVCSEKSLVNPAVAVPLLDLSTETRLSYHYHGKVPHSAEELSTSALRFSWEYQNPSYYAPTEYTEEGGSAVVIISDGTSEQVPEEIRQRLSGMSKKVSFVTTDNIYEYQSVVTIFHNEKSGGNLVDKTKRL